MEEEFYGEKNSIFFWKITLTIFEIFSMKRHDDEKLRIEWHFTPFSHLSDILFTPPTLYVFASICIYLKKHSNQCLRLDVKIDRVFLGA